MTLAYLENVSHVNLTTPFSLTGHQASFIEFKLITTQMRHCGKLSGWIIKFIKLKGTVIKNGCKKKATRKSIRGVAFEHSAESCLDTEQDKRDFFLWGQGLRKDELIVKG